MLLVESKRRVQRHRELFRTAITEGISDVLAILVVKRQRRRTKCSGSESGVREVCGCCVDGRRE